MTTSAFIRFVKDAFHVIDVIIVFTCRRVAFSLRRTTARKPPSISGAVRMTGTTLFYTVGDARCAVFGFVIARVTRECASADVARDLTYIGGKLDFTAVAVCAAIVFVCFFACAVIDVVTLRAGNDDATSIFTRCDRAVFYSFVARVKTCAAMIFTRIEIGACPRRVIAAQLNPLTAIALTFSLHANLQFIAWYSGISAALGIVGFTCRIVDFYRSVLTCVDDARTFGARAVLPMGDLFRT